MIRILQNKWLPSSVGTQTKRRILTSLGTLLWPVISSTFVIKWVINDLIKGPRGSGGFMLWRGRLYGARIIAALLGIPQKTLPRKGLVAMSANDAKPSRNTKFVCFFLCFSLLFSFLSISICVLYIGWLVSASPPWTTVAAVDWFLLDDWTRRKERS